MRTQRAGCELDMSHAINDTGIKPVQSDVLVRRVDCRTHTKGRPGHQAGLVLPQGSEVWEPIGKVLAVGPSVENPEIAPGVIVLFKNRPSSALIPDNREGGRPEWERVIRLREEDILGIVVDYGTPGVEVE